MQRTWHQNVATDATLVFYMPGSDFKELHAELRECGIAEDTPCLLISRVSRGDQTMVKTVVRALLTAPPVAAPSLLIIGEAASQARGCEEVPLAAAVTEILFLDPEREKISSD